MLGIPACGLLPSFSEFSSTVHQVNLVYASAVPVNAYLNKDKVDATFQEEVSRLMITAQYYGALRLASLQGPSRKKIYLMPLGGGVFNNRSETIAGAISTAIEILAAEGVDVSAAVDIRLLTFRGKETEAREMAALMERFQKLLQ